MADSLGRQSVAMLQANQLYFLGLCVNPSHDHECLLLQALQTLNISNVLVLTAFVVNFSMKCLL
jgi:multisubunit Na+/H+ antiporter MnhC subunit